MPAYSFVPLRVINEMMNLPEQWPCDASELNLRLQVSPSGVPVQCEGNPAGCLLYLGSDCQGTQEDHGEPDILEEWGLSSMWPEQMPTGVCRQEENKSPICLAGCTFNLWSRSARILLKTMGFLTPVCLATLGTIQIFFDISCRSV